MDWHEFWLLWLIGFFVVATVRYYEGVYRRKLYPAAWAFGTGMLYGVIDHAVTAHYAIP